MLVFNLSFIRKVSRKRMVQSRSDRSLNKSDTKNRVHLNKCQCPTAISLDLSNVRTINGPNSTLRKLLDINNGPKSATTTRSNILKHIYYKSAWYDIPPGSSRSRFRNFVKLAPNSNA